MKIKYRLFACLLAVMLCMTAFSVTAFAGGGEDYYPTVEPTEPVQTTQPLTPSGNLTLIDDILQSKDTDDEEAELENKQFITVQSKAGNYFYLIIDRSSETENVYFLNLVDEADLMALIEKDETADTCTCTDKCVVGAINTACAVCQYNMSECTGKAATQETPTQPEPEPEPEPEKGGINPTLILLVVLLLAGGGAVYFLKFKKKKPDTTGPIDLDDYDYGDDEDYEAEALPETEDDVPEDDAQ
ncbi:MAG: DUF4366 domain-containing protein [Oscillospiraceae bacterium]|nr:DUF4366 domain-containing protein [Oscillospiraceae bacterium]